MVTIIDYGIGNLRSIEKAFEAVGGEVLRTDRADDLVRAERLVLPGVGAFGACADEIRHRDLEGPILDAVARGTPLLGVCVGMQLLFDESEEMGVHRGLGVLPGRVVRFSPNGDGPRLKIPHMGWNVAVPRHTAPLLDGLGDDAYFYFVHSYHAAPARPADILATTSYGVDFPAMVHHENVYGVQFHPEKSQRNGLRILKNFAELSPSNKTSLQRSAGPQ